MAEGNYCIIGLILIGIIIFISYNFLKLKNEPSETISLLEESPKEKLAVDEEIRPLNQIEFDWIQSQNILGELFNSSEPIYINTNYNFDEVQFRNNYMVITNCKFLKADNAISLRIRWKQYNYHKRHQGQSIYEFKKADVRLYFPREQSEKVETAVEEFNHQIELNMEEIRRVTPPDKLNGLFWKDDF